MYQVLDHFLTILDLSHKLTHGWKGKVRVAVELAAFGKDPGIKDAMVKLETLICDVTSTEISVILNDLSKAARNMRDIDAKLDRVADASERTLASVGHLEISSDKLVAAVGNLETADKRRTADEEARKRLDKLKEIKEVFGKNDYRERPG